MSTDNLLPRIEYLESGFKGTILYIGEQGAAQFDYDMDRDDCVALIVAPGINDWESKTKIVPAFREEILTYIAKEFVMELAITCTYEISEQGIFFRPPAQPKMLNSKEIITILGVLLIVAGIIMKITGTSLNNLRAPTGRGTVTNYNMTGTVVILFGLVLLFFQIQWVIKKKR